MVIGEPIVENETVFCTWHGIKETNVYLDSSTGFYGIAQSGIVMAIKNTLSEIAKLYVEMTWNSDEKPS